MYKSVEPLYDSDRLIEKRFSKINLLDISLKNYIKYENSASENIDSKKDIIFELSKKLKDIKIITKHNINIVIDKLIDINSLQEIIVDEISLCNMKKYIELKPKDAIKKWNILLDKDRNLENRINAFEDVTIEDKKEFTKSYGSDFYVELDSISLILAAFYFGEYPMYRDRYFKKFVEIMNIELDQKSFGSTYREYLLLVNVIIDKLKKLHRLDNVDVFIVEDIIYTFVNDEKLREDSITEYLNELALEFDFYKHKSIDKSHNKDLTLEYKSDYKICSSTDRLEPIDFKKPLEFDCLYFEKSEILKTQISSALISGKSIILTGPPGTGKSKLAKEIARSLKADFKMVTALSSWTSYDTIGGYKPCDDGSLYFEEGIFLSCLKDRLGDNKNQWLVIDEINRADIDKAFGSFFSTISGDDVTLGLKDKNGRDIEIILEGNLTQNRKSNRVVSNEYVVPKDFRIIGTMNTMDKSSLYDMSYAFMRRFAFIPVSIPIVIDCSTVKEYTNIWDITIEDAECENISKLWNKINEYRKVGPALVEDIVKFIISGGDYTSSIIIYILPQLEGLFDDTINSFTDSIGNLSFIEDKQRLKVSIEDFFNLDLSEQ